MSPFVCLTVSTRFFFFFFFLIFFFFSFIEVPHITYNTNTAYNTNITYKTKFLTMRNTIYNIVTLPQY